MHRKKKSPLQIHEMDNESTIYTQTPYFSERRDFKLLDYSEKIYSKLPYSLYKKKM